MEPSQADAIAQAILKPDPDVQQALHRKRKREEEALARRRFVALWMLPACAAGAAVAYLSGHRFTEGVLWGGMAGAVTAWAILLFRRPGKDATD